MNIDYAAIIEKANARKDALQKFELALQGLRGEINESGDPDLITALQDFQKACCALDAEAQNMLPPGALNVARHFAANVLAMWAYVDKISGSALSIQMTPRAALNALAGE